MADYDNSDTISVDTIFLEETVTKERNEEIATLKDLSKKGSFFHTNLIYYRDSKTKLGNCCYEIWKILVRNLGGSQNSWRDFGSLLGLKSDELDYIKNTVKDDPADVVLKVFMQNENATLDKIIKSCIKMERYDIAKALECHLNELNAIFNKEDSGYHSNDVYSKTKEIFKLNDNLPTDLPAVLKKKQNKEIKNPNRPSELSISSLEIDSKAILLLTFTSDGAETAQNIENYVNNWSDSNVIVMTLNSVYEALLENPENTIKDLFKKAKFVVPILTTGYLKEITTHRSLVQDCEEDVNKKYAPFIYSLIVTHYIHATGCLNKKVRSVLPKQFDAHVLKNINTYPDLMPWTNEHQFTENFKVFLKLPSQ